MSSTGSPIVDNMIQPFRRGVKRVEDFASHPIDSIREMLGSAPASQPAQHDQEIQRMNQEINSHRNDPANDSFKPKLLPRMK